MWDVGDGMWLAVIRLWVAGLSPQKHRKPNIQCPHLSTHWSLWGGERQGGTCPLLLDGVDVGLGELPTICELLPLMRPQVPGGQSPQHTGELPPFLPMVLLKGQVLPTGIPGVPAPEVILWSRSPKCSCHLGGNPCQALPWEFGWGSGRHPGLGLHVCYSGFSLCALLRLPEPQQLTLHPDCLFSPACPSTPLPQSKDHPQATSSRKPSQFLSFLCVLTAQVSAEGLSGSG